MYGLLLHVPSAAVCSCKLGTSLRPTVINMRFVCLLACLLPCLFAQCLCGERVGSLQNDISTVQSTFLLQGNEKFAHSNHTLKVRQIDLAVDHLRLHSFISLGTNCSGGHTRTSPKGHTQNATEVHTKTTTKGHTKNSHEEHTKASPMGTKKRMLLKNTQRLPPRGTQRIVLSNIQRLPPRGTQRIS